MLHIDNITACDANATHSRVTSPHATDELTEVHVVVNMDRKHELPPEKHPTHHHIHSHERPHPRNTGAAEKRKQWLQLCSATNKRPSERGDDRMTWRPNSPAPERKTSTKAHVSWRQRPKELNCFQMNNTQSHNEFGSAHKAPDPLKENVSQTGNSTVTENILPCPKTQRAPTCIHHQKDRYSEAKRNSANIIAPAVRIALDKCRGL